VYGKGLWSTLYGFLSVEADKATVRGITFYKHAETPGLGGEVDNANWKQLWHGKQAFDSDGAVALGVIKGKAPAEDPHAVDGLSGATITSNGVDDMVKYWLGPEGFGKFLASN
jgi:Na+-transporting NADH:ubiquinone oxidoreductase subunit C